jgi:hypothetical protein
MKKFWIIREGDPHPEEGEIIGPFKTIEDTQKELALIAKNEKWDSDCRHFMDEIESIEKFGGEWSELFHIVQTVSSGKIWAIPQDQKFEYREETK